MLHQLIGRFKTLSKKAIGVRLTALDRLRADHMRIERLAVQLRMSRNPRKKRVLLERLRGLLGRHMKVEEQIFYPACARIEPLRALIDHSHTDHQLAKNVLKDLAVMNPASGQFNSLLTKLILKLEKHVHLEEQQVFQGVVKHMSREQIRSLTREMSEGRARITSDRRRAA